MSLVSSSLHTLRSILASSINEEGITLIDSTPTIYGYSAEGEYVKHANLKGVESFINRYGKSVAMSSNGKFALVSDQTNNRALFLSLEPIKMLSIISMPKPDVVLFNEDSTLLIIGSESGRLDIYKTDDCSRILELHFSDSIVCAAFSKNGTSVAIATMDKKIHLYRLDAGKIIHAFRVDGIVESLTFSADHNKIIGFTRFGATYVLNILLKQQFIGDPTFEWPTRVASGFNDNIVLLGTRSNQLLIYNNSDGIKLGCFNFNFWGITSLSVSAEKVLVGFSDGNGVVIDMNETLKEASSALEGGNIAKLSRLVAEQPLIFINQDLCTKMERHYEAIFRFKPSGVNERKGHEAIVSLIIADSTLRRELMQSLYSSEEIVPFMEKISLGNAQGACTSVYKSPHLRQLREFHEVRSSCLKELMHEIKLLEIDPEKFNEYISSVEGGCNKCVHNLIPRPEELEENYKKLLSSASSGNFSALAEIGEQHEILRQTKVYRRFMNYGEALIDKILARMAAGKMDQAEEYAVKLIKIKPFFHTGNYFKNQIKAFDAFVSYAAGNNLAKLFLLSTEYPALRTTQIFKDQIDTYKRNIVTPANNLAKNGEVTKVMKLLAPYLTIEYFEEKNLLLFKKALVHEIELYAPIGEEQLLLERYHGYFGWDNEYAQVCLTLKVEPNLTRKPDIRISEYKTVTTLLQGSRVLRTLQNQETA
ncbi:hypothetical protein Sulku_1193 [Sulfuricurvum kujiense DSM 16994]|uniref:WD40 repeat, subgroup n=1 Tax=Sulfuricurvum kujiense (strain ATCC BAA-921 / DSM 16994 / JCM 11577 / YK-1) TaxID=709032 RepID=E4TX15_SULKY|nr:WD40 repeat domain-containing protein [Sulfuricurvum kujiense]ADR33856.1 hypothetical protein Sulku_1193 [Sulfuricurvum kujiense DSM 16994]